MSLLFFLTVLFLPACQSSKSSYENPDEMEIVGDKFGVSDLNVAVAQLIQDLMGQSGFQNWQRSHETSKPYVLWDRMLNKTSEVNLPVQMINNQVRNELIRSGQVRFIDGELRKKLLEEYKYQSASGAVDPESLKKKGKQIAPDLFLNGTVSSLVAQEKGVRTVYYEISVRATDVETSEIVAIADARIKKRFQNKNFSL